VSEPASLHAARPGGATVETGQSDHHGQQQACGVHGVSLTFFPPSRQRLDPSTSPRMMSPMISDPAQKVEPAPTAMPSGAKSTGSGIESVNGTASAGAVTPTPTIITTGTSKRALITTWRGQGPSVLRRSRR
jgi:hypothetical protein